MSNNLATQILADDQLGSFLVIIVIIVLAGLVGGYAAYLGDDSATPDAGSAPNSRLKMFVLGIVAAACVPLFLSLVKSGLIKDILANTNGGRLESFLVLGGLCLVAALSSRKFIDSVSRQILQRLDKAEETAADAKKTAREVATEVDLEAADDANEPRPAEVEAAAALESLGDTSPEPLSPEERRILQALTKRTYRTRSGIAEDSGISKMRISEFLEALADRKLALPTTSPRTGGSRWIITSRGQAALGSAT